MMIDYMTVEEAARYVGCSDQTIRNYLRISDPELNPFSDVIVMEDGYSGPNPVGLNLEEVSVFADWYHKKRKKDKFRRNSEKVEQTATVSKRIKNDVLIEEMRHEITQIGIKMMGLLGKLQELEKEL